jgi:hypothetical protein
MAKQIEQPLHIVSESSPLFDEPAEPISTPPTLTLVGGTDVTPQPLDPSSPLRP